MAELDPEGAKSLVLEKTATLLKEGEATDSGSSIPGNSTPEKTTQHTLTDWDSPDDPAKPWNWPLATKLYGVAVPAWYAFAITFGTSVYAAGVFDIEAKFHVSPTLAIAGLSLYALGTAVGPVLGAPISETLGRKYVYLITMPLLVLFSLGVALAKNIGTILVCRFFSALLGAPAMAVGAGSTADLFDMQKGGGVASVFFILMPFLGSSFGPLVGGYTIEARHDYQWTMWVLIMVGGPAWIASFFLKETSHKIILKNRALERGMAPPPKLPPKAALKFLLTVTLFRPMHMLLFEPIIGWTTLYVAFAFGLLFAFFDAFPYIFSTVYGFSLGQIGLTYLGIIVGIFSAAVTFIIIDQTIYTRAKARAAPGKAPPPEERLYACMVGSFMLPVSLFWLAWTSRADIHWIVPILAGWPFGWGLVLLFIGTSTYLIDAYQSLNAASAIAANGLLRYVFGAAFPLFTVQMFMRLGINWALSLFGFLSLAMLPIPWILYRWGPLLRSRSSYDMGKF